jgi:hypothetical protein
LLHRRVGKGEREEADTYAPVSTVCWNLPEFEFAELAKKRLEIAN